MRRCELNQIVKMMISEAGWEQRRNRRPGGPKWAKEAAGWDTGGGPLTVHGTANVDNLQAREPVSGPSQRHATAEGMSPSERRLLATMPLHAITSLHGEAGLRERLTIEAESFPAADRDRITRAFDLAARLHIRDRRQREPYLNHLLRVAIRVISHYSVRDPDIVCAALLHDAVEDHTEDLAPHGRQQDALAVLAKQFGTRVADLIAAVTNPAPRIRARPSRAIPCARSGQP
jgi:hypothetical protein